MKIVLDDPRIKYEAPMQLFFDNKNAINIVHNLVQYDMTKHTKLDEQIDRHSICSF